MNHDGVSVTAFMVLVAFALERVTTAVLFLISFGGKGRRFLLGSPDDKPGDAERRYKLTYFLCAGALAMLVVIAGPAVRVLTSLGMNSPALLDIAVTWLVLIAGADRIGDLVGGKRGAGSFAEKPAKPVQIEGTVTLLEEHQRPQKQAAA